MQIEITKKKAIAIGISIIIAIAIITTTVYSIVTVNSNHVIVTPKSTPILTLSVNNTGIVYVGDGLLLTAQFNTSTVNLPVTFFNNGSVIGGGSFNTDANGKATLTIIIGSNNIDNLTASCTVPNTISNSILIIPVQGVITLSVDSNNPYVGETIILTVQVNHNTANVPITFFLNSQTINVNPIYTDINGTSTLPYKVTTNNALDFSATAQFP